MSEATTSRDGASRLVAGRDSAGLLDRIERRCGITRNGLSVLGTAAVAYVLGRLLRSQAVILLVYGSLIVLAISWLLGRRNLAVEAHRSDLPLRVREGQLVGVELVLTANRRITSVILEEEIPSRLGATVRVPVPLLSSGGEVKHQYSFVPRLRGVYPVGPLVATWSDPFGLTRRRQVLTPAVDVIVHPRTELAEDRVLSREWEDPPIRPPFSRAWPSGFEFYGMRDYSSGDDPRRIVWRKTAQYLDPLTGVGRYLVRESEQGITDRVSIILDNDVEWHSPGRPSETFESAVRVVASVGAKHLRDGFSVTVEGNSGRLVDAVRGRGSARVRLLDVLARVQPERASLESLLQRLLVGSRRDTHFVLVTPHLEQGAAARIRLLLNRGVSVLVVMVVGDEFDYASMHRAGALGCNIVEVPPGAPLSKVFAKVMGTGIR